MARIRSIKPDFWTDEKVVELSPFARLLFIGLWNFADDEGRMTYSPTSIKLKILPADSLNISELIGELRGKSLITIYAIDGIEYLQVNGFADHQKIDKRTASKLPPPPNSPESQLRKGREWNGRDQGKEGKEPVGAAPNGALHAPDALEIVLTLPLQDGSDFGVNKSLIAELEPLYPAVDVPQTLREMKGWLVGNPNRRKTRSGARKFITSWLQREQEKHGG